MRTFIIQASCGRRIWRSEDEDDESHDHAKQSRRDARSLALWGWLVRYVYVEDLDKRCMIRSEVYLVSKYASAKGPSATHAWQHKLHCAHPYPGVSVSCEQEQRAKSLPLPQPYSSPSCETVLARPPFRPTKELKGINPTGQPAMSRSVRQSLVNTGLYFEPDLWHSLHWQPLQQDSIKNREGTL